MTGAREVRTAAGTITYHEAGSGPPLVFLHGIGSAGQSFADQLDGLSGRFRVIAWDAPGYGGSAAPAAEAPDAGIYADALAAFLDALEIPACHLVGHSLGALMAARFAALWPQRVLSLALASIAVGQGYLPDSERETLVAQRLGDLDQLGARGMAEKRGPRLLGPDADETMIRRVIDTMAAVRPDGYPRAVRMLSQGDVLTDVARLPADLPLQIVFGSADVITPPERNRSVAVLRPEAPVHEIPGAGHAVYLEKPDQFNAVIGGFAARHAKTGVPA